MKIRSILNNTALVLMAAFSAVSCNESEETLEVLTDVYVINKKFGTEVKSQAMLIIKQLRRLKAVMYLLFRAIMAKCSRCLIY